jgi:tetratricopeptide (TPR) repeat protein
MGASPCARRLILCLIVPAAALALAVGCAAPTPEDLYNQAEASFNQQDAVETELTLDRLLKTADLDEALAVRAHLLRAANYAIGLNDIDKCREELQTALNMATINSDEGVIAAIFLARSYLPSEGLAGFDRIIDEELAKLPPLSQRALNLNFSRWQVMDQQHASPEMAAFYPKLLAEVVSTEDLTDTDKRALALEITRQRVEIAHEMNDEEGAIGILEHFIGLFPGSDPAMFMPVEIAAIERRLGRVEAAQRRIDEAFAAYNRQYAAAQTSAEQATVVRIRADAYLTLSEMSSAEREFNTLIDTYLDFQLRPQSMITWAIELLNQGRFEEARDLATRIALDYPNSNWNVWANRIIQQIDASAEALASREAVVPAPAVTSPEVVASPEAAPVMPEVTPGPVEVIPVSPEEASPQIASAEVAAEPASP